MSHKLITNYLDGLIPDYEIGSNQFACTWGFPTALIDVEAISIRHCLTLQQVSLGIIPFAAKISNSERHPRPFTAHLPLLTQQINEAKSLELSPFFYFLRASMNDTQIIEAGSTERVRVNHMRRNPEYCELILLSMEAYFNNINGIATYEPDFQSRRNNAQIARAGLRMKFIKDQMQIAKPTKIVGQNLTIVEEQNIGSRILNFVGRVVGNRRAA